MPLLWVGRRRTGALRLQVAQRRAPAVMGLPEEEEAERTRGFVGTRHDAKAVDAPAAACQNGHIEVRRAASAREMSGT
jgi:hypothetical protein